MSMKTSEYYRELAYECLNLRDKSKSGKQYKYYQRKANRYMRRAAKIFTRAMCRTHSPSLGRRVKISDIWNTPNYE